MLLTALPMLCATAAAAVQPGAPNLEAALLAELRTQYPAVARWDIRPFADGAERTSGAVAIVRLGSRSAVRVGGRVYWYAVAGFQNVIHASRAISARESLDEHAGHAVEADVVAAGCTPIADLARLNGTRARRALHPDQIICAEAIEPRPPVARGDDVTVRYVGARVSLVAKGTAVTDGALGERVDVRSLESAQTYRAVVSGMREVTIHD